MKVNKHHRKLANNALLPAPKWIPAVISPNYIYLFIYLFIGFNITVIN